MRIRYKDIDFSIKIDLYKKNIHKEHGPSLVRNKNIRQNQTLMYDEEINENLIIYEPETNEESEYLKESLNESDTVTMLRGGWKAIEGVLYTRRSNANNSNQPGFMNLGNGIEGVTFADYKNQGVSLHFNLGPEYKKGTKIYMDIHWVPLSSSRSKVLFGINWTANDANVGKKPFIDDLNVMKISASGSGLKGELRRITVSDDAFVPNADANGLLSMELHRLGKDGQDTFYGNIGVVNVTIYYQIPHEEIAK